MSVESLEVSEKHQELQPHEAKDKTCENCGAQLDGQFCAECGQEITSNIRYFGTVILHLLDDIFSFDSRASRTLYPLLAKPGFLTLKYFQGKRVHYVPPLRLYLFISIIFFLSLKLFTDIATENLQQVSAEEMQQSLANKLVQLESSTDDVKKQENIARLQNLLEDISQSKHVPLKSHAARLAELELKKLDAEQVFTEAEQQSYLQLEEDIQGYRENLLAGEETKPEISVSNQADGTLHFDFLSEQTNEKLNQQVASLSEKAEKLITSDPSKLIEQALGKLPQLMFVLLPIFALLLKVMYLFSGRLYMEHLTVALHSHSFIFLTILLIKLLDEAHDFVIASSTFLAGIAESLAVVLMTWLPIYLFLMQKRVYQQGYLFTAIKFSVIGVLYCILITLTGFIALVWGLTSI